MKVFSFDKEELTNYIRFDLDTFTELPDSLKYVADQLEKHKHCLKIKSLANFDLNKVKERKGKNYHWSSFKHKNITLVVRRYHSHLTIFTMFEKMHPKFEGVSRNKYGAFTFHTDFDKFGDEADNMRYEHYEKPFIDLNVIAKDLFEMMLTRDGDVWMVWNSVSLPRPDHVKIKLSFSGEQINSLDEFVFCMEELSNIHQELFAENDMLEKLKELKEGDMLNTRYKIGNVISTAWNDGYNDNYYHGAGIELIDTMNKNESRFTDVYSLTQWYLTDIFKEQ